MSGLPQATWSGVFKLFGTQLKAYQLDNGERVIDAEDMNRLILVMSEGKAGPANEADMAALAAWIKGGPSP